MGQQELLELEIQGRLEILAIQEMRAILVLEEMLETLETQVVLELEEMLETLEILVMPDLLVQEEMLEVEDLGAVAAVAALVDFLL